jgi:hypothetical protein
MYLPHSVTAVGTSREPISVPYLVNSIATVTLSEMGISLYLYCSLYQEVERVEILYLYLHCEVSGPCA